MENDPSSDGVAVANIVVTEIHGNDQILKSGLTWV
jgi:hypothetical protein